MIWVVLGAATLTLLIIGAVITAVVGVVFAPHRVPPTRNQYLLLAVAGFAAVIGSQWALSSAAGGGWAMPLALWVLLLTIIRNRAPMRETPWQRKAREKARERERADTLGRAGVGLIDRARTAVSAVMATEAARDGWLGDPTDLDFSADLAAMEDTLRQARRIEKLVAESRALPEPTDDDARMLGDAERTVGQLRSDVLRRVQVLDDCARQARQIDQSLAAERERARLAARRDVTRGRLAAELYGAAVAPSDPASEAADGVAARVAAFRDLKGLVDEPPRPGGRVDPPQQTVLHWLRRQIQP